MVMYFSSEKWDGGHFYLGENSSLKYPDFFNSLFPRLNKLQLIVHFD